MATRYVQRCRQIYVLFFPTVKVARMLDATGSLPSVKHNLQLEVGKKSYAYIKESDRFPRSVNSFMVET